MSLDENQSPIRLLRSWENFWFQEIPPHSYALLRIAFGALGLINLLGSTPVAMFWPVDSLAPLPGQGLGFRTLLLSLGLGTVAGWALFCGLFVCFAGLTLGYLTGLAAVFCFIGSVLQAYWNHLPLSSAHQVLVVVLFCLVWADSGAAVSVDSWLTIRRATPSCGSNDMSQPIWPLQLIRIQIALIYLNSGLWKLFGAVWRDGSAIHYVLNHNVFQRFPSAIPAGAEPLVTLGTYLTLFWEMAFPFMMFHSLTRRLALVMGVLLHLGVWATLEVGPFSWLMIASYLAFLNPFAVSRFLVRHRAPFLRTGLATARARSSA